MLQVAVANAGPYVRVATADARQTVPEVGAGVMGLPVALD